MKTLGVGFLFFISSAPLQAQPLPAPGNPPDVSLGTATVVERRFQISFDECKAQMRFIDDNGSCVVDKIADQVGQGSRTIDFSFHAIAGYITLSAQGYFVHFRRISNDVKEPIDSSLILGDL